MRTHTLDRQSPGNHFEIYPDVILLAFYSNIQFRCKPRWKERQHEPINFLLPFIRIFSIEHLVQFVHMENPYLLSCAGNWIKANVWKEYNCRPTKHSSDPIRKVPIVFKNNIKFLPTSKTHGKGSTKTVVYPFGSSYPTHPVLKPIYPPAAIMKIMAETFIVVTMVCATELWKVNLQLLKRN